MYCPTCREPGRFPWQHSEDCRDRPQHELRWYRAGIPLLLVLVGAQLVLLLVAFKLVGGCL